MSEKLMKKFDLQLEQLTFEYVNDCNNVKTLEKIVRVLRSGEEGHYPQLQQKAESRLAELSTNNKLLRKEEPLARKNDFPDHVWKELETDLVQWTKEVKSQEDIFKNLKETPGSNLPNVREIKDINGTVENCLQNGKTVPPLKLKDRQKIERTDYDGWSKFNAEEEILKIEIAEERKEEEERKLKLAQEKKDMVFSTSEPDPDLPDELRRFEAQKAREKGNEYFKTGDLQLALSFYNKSLAFETSCLACNNRAMTYIKLKDYKAALKDCEYVLSREPNNLKALVRRATCLKESTEEKDWKAALNDLETVLKFEPNNKSAQSDYQKIRMKLNLPENTSKVRLEIEESSKDLYSGEERISLAEAAREKGNESFKLGDLQTALKHYTESLNLYKTCNAANNRAMTYIKLGRYKDAIIDCNYVLSQEPNNVKALMRRSTCYIESTVQSDWRKAMVDLEKLIKLEPRNSVAQQAYQQIRKKLLLSERNYFSATGKKPVIYYWPSTSYSPVMQALYPNRPNANIFDPEIYCRCQRSSYLENPMCSNCGEQNMEKIRRRCDRTKWDPSMSARKYVKIMNERKTNLYVSPPRRPTRAASQESPTTPAKPAPASCTPPLDDSPLKESSAQTDLPLLESKNVPKANNFTANENTMLNGSIPNKVHEVASTNKESVGDKENTNVSEDLNHSHGQVEEVTKVKKKNRKKKKKKKQTDSNGLEIKQEDLSSTTINGISKMVGHIVSNVTGNKCDLESSYRKNGSEAVTDLDDRKVEDSKDSKIEVNGNGASVSESEKIPEEGVVVKTTKARKRKKKKHPGTSENNGVIGGSSELVNLQVTTEVTGQKSHQVNCVEKECRNADTSLQKKNLDQSKVGDTGSSSQPISTTGKKKNRKRNDRETNKGETEIFDGTRSVLSETNCNHVGPSNQCFIRKNTDRPAIC